MPKIIRILEIEVIYPAGFEGFKNQSGENSFVLSTKKLISATNAIGIKSKLGCYGGGTFAQHDISSSWQSPQFKLI